MKMSHTLLALSVSLMAFATPAMAAITVTFTESATEGNPNPIPTVECTAGTACQFSAQGGAFSTVALANFFATAPAAFSFTYNLLEPPGSGNELNLAPGVSDQITFTRDGTTLIILFSSDPLLNPLVTPYGSALETGGFQTIPLPANMPTGLTGLTVLAQSELESGVPEPATWAMMLLGFGAVGLAIRSRRRRAMLAQIA